MARRIQANWRDTGGTVGIKDRRDLTVGVQGQEFRCPGLIPAGVDRVRLVGQTNLLQHDRHLHPIGGRQRVDLEVMWTLRCPALRKRKSGPAGHGEIHDRSQSVLPPDLG